MWNEILKYSCHFLLYVVSIYVSRKKKKRAENQKDETPTSLMPEFSEIFKRLG